MEKLTGYIQLQAEKYQTLLEKAQAKQRAIIENDLQAMETLNKEEEQIITEVAAMEDLRIKYIQQNPDIFGADAMQLTLEELKLRFDDRQRESLDQATATLMETIKQLQTVNSENAELLKQALRLVNVTINTITGNMEPAGYVKEKGSQVSQNQNVNKNLFDKKI